MPSTNLTKLADGKLAELCAKNPNDPILRVRLAESYQQKGHMIRSVYTARRAHALFGKEKNKLQQRIIIKQFGKLASSEKATDLVSNAFKRISNEMGMISKRIKKITLDEGQALFEKGDPIDYVYLITKGEVSIFDTEKSRQASSLVAGEGALVYAYNAIPQQTNIVDELEDSTLLEKEVEYATKTKIYRGSEVLVEDQKVKVNKKPKMYRGQVVPESEGGITKQATNTTYRGNELNATLKGVHRYASITANSKCTLLKFTPQEIATELHKYEGMHELFLKDSSIHFQFSRVAISKFFSGLPIDLRYMIATVSKVTLLSEGHIIKGIDSSNTLHIISAGHMQVYQENEENELNYLGRLETGDMVGIEAVLSEKPLNLVFQAEQSCEVLKLDVVVLKDIMALSEKFKTLLRTSYAKMKADFS